ncbi:MAG: ATP-binding protein, partial [Actinomycetota bacterium]
MDPCPVLVGREQELAALRAVLDAGGGVAIVSGEAGIGKSRLVREFANEAVARGRLDLWARPEEVAQPGPYALIVDLLESIAERGGGSIKTEARTLIAELSRTDESDQRPAPSPRTVAAEIRGLVSQLKGSPLIVMEDLHWADERSHSVILHLMRAARDDQHVVIATMRPERGKSEESL